MKAVSENGVISECRRKYQKWNVNV
jgi:hypothetical protein